MLLPDNIHPEQSIYFAGAKVLQTLQEHPVIELLDLYNLTRARQDLSMPVFVLCLDWLFLLNLVMIDDRGRVCLCS